MLASALPGEAPPADQAEPASLPLRVALLVAEPVRAQRLRTALGLSSDLHILADPADAADLVVADATPAVLRALALGKSPAAPAGAPVTSRERQVLELLAAGASNKMIARRLDISIATAKFHVAALLAKLGAQRRSDAVAIGVRRGLLML